MLAWLAATEETAAPAPGEWYGTAAYTIKKCGATFGGYCDIRKGVDLTIDTRAP